MPEINAFELRETRRRQTEGRHIIRETRFYRVDGVQPDDALLEGVLGSSGPFLGGPFPDIGALLPDDNQQGEGAAKGVQLRRRTVDHFQGQLNTSLVTLFYSTGPNVGGLDESGTLRKTIWIVKPTAEFETIQFDLGTPASEGQPAILPKSIPGGAVRRTPLVSSTAILDGTTVSFNMLQLVGTTNRGLFHGWNEGEMLYVGASSELIHGYDTEDLGNIGDSLARVSLHFLSKPGGEFAWHHRVHNTDASNVPDGTFTNYKIYKSVPFLALFWGSGFSE